MRCPEFPAFMTVAYNRLPPHMDIDDDGNVTQNTIEGTSMSFSYAESKYKEFKIGHRHR